MANGKFFETPGFLTLKSKSKNLKSQMIPLNYDNLKINQEYQYF